MMNPIETKCCPRKLVFHMQARPPLGDAVDRVSCHWYRQPRAQWQLAGILGANLGMLFLWGTFDKVSLSLIPCYFSIAKENSFKLIFLSSSNPLPNPQKKPSLWKSMLGPLVVPFGVIVLKSVMGLS